MFGHILIFVLTLFAPSQSADVENILSCTIVPLDHVNGTCVNTDLTSFSFSTRITGINLGEYHAARITNLFLASKYMYYVPNNIFKFFPNVTEIRIHTAVPQLIKVEKQHFSGLVKLQKLLIVGQRLRHIGPDVFQGAPSITDLFLPSNQIQSISELAFDGLVNCKHLILSGNQIDQLKAGTFAPMPNLWSVNLSKNRLMILREYTFASNKVVLLDLSHNKIESIPENIVKNFISSKDPKRLLSMRGNICDNRIYTKNTHRVEKNLANCIKGSTFLPDRELVERLREEIRTLEQNNAKLDLENHNLLNENDRLLSELKTLDINASCNEEKCRTLYRHMWQQPVNAIQKIVPKLKFWREKSQSLFLTLATIGDGTCVDENISRPSNDCSSPEQLNLLTSAENQLNGLMRTARSLSGQNLALNRFAREILITVENSCTTTVAPLCEVCPESTTLAPKFCPEIICPPPPICEMCPESTTLGPMFCPEVVCPPIRCPPCFGTTTSTERTPTDSPEKPCLEFMQTIETLEAELILLRAINSTYHKKTFKATCGVEIEIEELDRIVLTQSIEIESMKKVVDDLTQGMLLLRKEAESVDGRLQRRLADNFDLKEENAKCTALRQIDLIEITSKVSKTLQAEKDQMLKKVIVELEKLIDIQHEGSEDLESPEQHPKNLVENAAARNPEVTAAIMQIISVVKTKYQQVKSGDTQIHELVAQISWLLKAIGRRGLISDKVQQINDIIIHTISTVEKIIQEQYDILRKHSEKIANLFSSSIAKLGSIFGRRSAADNGTSIIFEPLNGLNKTLVEKDDLLRNKYNKIELYINEIKESRAEVLQAYAEYISEKKDVMSSPQMDDLDDITEYMDDRCMDRTDDRLKKTVGDQLTRIGVLREEVDTASDTMAKMKTLFKDLLKQCNHCRSFMSKGAGFFKKLFGKTSGCDFAAYEKQKLSFFN